MLSSQSGYICCFLVPVGALVVSPRRFAARHVILGPIQQYLKVAVTYLVKSQSPGILQVVSHNFKPRWSDRRLGSATKRVNFKLRPCIAPDSGGDHRSTHNTHVYDQKPVCHAAVFALGPRFPRSGDRLLYRAGLTSFLFSEFSERDPRSPRPGFVRRCPPSMPRA
jgi:hypothetical protein